MTSDQARSGLPAAGADSVSPWRSSDPSARFLEELRDAAVAMLPKVCEHVRPCACRQRWIGRFITVGAELANQGWVVSWPR